MVKGLELRNDQCFTCWWDLMIMKIDGWSVWFRRKNGGQVISVYCGRLGFFGEGRNDGGEMRDAREIRIYGTSFMGWISIQNIISMF